jgi:alpha-tubulin suppressor-like RCC1 family protein
MRESELEVGVEAGHAQVRGVRPQRCIRDDLERHDVDWTGVAAGYVHTCGLRAGGTLYCWGANGSGEIGDGTSWSATPVIVQL